jgi:hypothetical protein
MVISNENKKANEFIYSKCIKAASNKKVIKGILFSICI